MPHANVGNKAWGHDTPLREAKQGAREQATLAGSAQAKAREGFADAPNE